MSLEITRRSFLTILGGAAGGLALGLRFGTGLAEAAEAGSSGWSPNAFVQIGTDGRVTIVCHRAEMGQGVRSSLPMVIADELGADWSSVRVVQGDGDKRYGDQNTDGSNSVRGFFHDMRVAGATARTMLIAAAAQRWNVPAAGLTAHDHAVHDESGRSLGFGELALAAAALPVPAAESVTLRPLSELRHVGKSMPFLDAAAYVDGTAKFGADVRLPGMLTAVIARPPVVGGKVVKVDDAAALQVPGVRRVVKLPEWKAPAGFQPLGGVAVVADHTWAALRGRSALQIEWEDGGNAVYDSTAYKAELEAAVRAPGEAVRKVGDADAALAAADRVITAEYHVPHLIHSPMEPPAAVARVDANGCEIWASTQNPQAAQEEAAKALGLDPSKVTVHVTFLGGGFGRKSKPDYVTEAALLSREVGAPVRVQWTRDDEIRHGYYHAVSTQRLEAGLDAQGKVTAWRHRIASPSIGSTYNKDAKRLSLGELSQGILDLPLAIPAVRVETCEAQAHVRIGWLRSVYNINHAFAVQSFIAELAAAAQRDPRDMLLEVIGPARHLTAAENGVDKLPNYGAALDEQPINTGRLRHVIEKVTANAGWDAPRQPGRALGLAAHRSFLTYTAVVAAVSLDPQGLPRVDEAWVAADAGTVVNPDRVRAQLEGAVVFGITAAMHGAITMRHGAVEQTNFRDYPLARIGEAPRAIHVELIESMAPPGGVGEPGVPPVAPAIANAVFALTGKRVRELPLRRA
jgi:isoquinoline 1-oxidoreductase beta subunit